MDTYEPVCITDISTLKPVFCCTPAFFNTSTTLNDIKFGKESKNNHVVDTSLHPLKSERNNRGKGFKVSHPKYWFLDTKL